MGSQGEQSSRQASDGEKGQRTPGKLEGQVTCLLGGQLGTKTSFSPLRAGGSRSSKR